MLTTRRNLPILTVAAALSVVTACGGDATDDAAGAATTADPTTTTTSTSSPSSDDTAAVDEDDRIVVLAEEFLLADVLALGFDPIASSATVADAGFQGLGEYDTSGTEVLPMTSLDLEQLAALDPDTIITLEFWAEQIGAETLSGLGELVTIPDGLATSERLTELGELLGKQNEAAELNSELDEATDAAAEAVPDDCRISLATIYGGPSPAAFVAGPWDIPSAVLSTGCALDPDASEAEPDQNGRVYLSTEELGMLDAPMLVLLQTDAVEGEQAAIDEISSEPLWQQLPAVQSGNVVEFDRLGYPGVEGQIRFLEEFAALFG